MPGSRVRYCEVASCSNTSENSGVSFFRFPSDKDRYSEWINRIGDLKSTRKFKLLCADHFTFESFTDSFRRQLHRTAMPLWHTSSNLARFPLKPLKRKDWQPSVSSRICSDFTEKDFDKSLGHRLKEDTVPSIFKGYPSYFQKKSSLKQKKVTGSLSSANDLKKVVKNLPESTNLSYVDNGSKLLNTEEILKQKLDKKSLLSENEIDENGPESTNNSDDLSCIASDSELMSPKEMLKKLETDKKKIFSEEETDADITKSTNNSVDLSHTENDSELLSSEELLKRKLEIMTAMFENSQKKLKHCQEQCKFYEEVIDNLKKINSINDHLQLT